MKTFKIDYTPDANETLLRTIFEAEGEAIRFVGGFVRDTLLGIEAKDKDFATTATPEKMIEIGRKHRINVVPTGLQHGTVTFVINHEPYEITTLRIDTDTDGRHAEVEFTRDFAKDAERRDLTINAMSMDFDGTVYDYFNGAYHLETLQILFVGQPLERVQEDYLRILRYFRFAARFDANMAAYVLDIFGRNDVQNGLFKISKERVWLEMSKLFMYDGAYRIMQHMHGTGIAAVIGLPGDRPPPTLGNTNSPEAAVALYFRGQGPEAAEFCRSWKMSAAETQKTTWIAQNYYVIKDAHDVEDMINDGVNREWVKELVYLNSGEYAKSIIQEYVKVEFPVKGQDLIDRGMKPGPMVGQVLAKMKADWKDSRYTLTRDELLVGF